MGNDRFEAPSDHQLLEAVGRGDPTALRQLMDRYDRLIRYAIYTRQSVDRLADFSSCQAQFHTCRDFAKATGEPYLHWCGQRFDDEGQSGAMLDRPGMRKLRKVIDLGGLERIYVVALDRLTRNMRDAVRLFDEFEKAGVDVRFVHQPELTLGAQGRFLRHVLAAFAEFERDMIATRIAESRAYLKQHGRRLAGNVPFGYDADPKTKQLMPNSDEAPRVAAIFKRAAGGQRPKQIAEAINRLGWRTKVYYAKRSGRTFGGNKWTARQIIDTLRNPVYVGRFADGADLRDGCHDAIVDQATFDAVQDQLDSRRSLLAVPVHICRQCGHKGLQHFGSRCREKKANILILSDSAWLPIASQALQYHLRSNHAVANICSPCIRYFAIHVTAFGPKRRQCTRQLPVGRVVVQYASLNNPHPSSC